MKDPYDVLGVPRNAGADVIKKTYRQLARKLHPDSAGDKPGAEDRFKDLSAAYELLSDSKKRASFDRGEIDASGNPTGRGGPFGGGRARPGGGRGQGRNPYDDFFWQRGARAGANIRIDGADVSYSLKVSFADAVIGANKHVSIASGKRLAVTIPAGTKSGQVLRLKGQGMDGLGGGVSGDAHVEIVVEPDSLFRREGHHIMMDCPVTLAAAGLGARIKVPTVHGPVTVTVPAGSNTGTTLRLKGKGVVDAKTKTGGDQLVSLKVVLPKEKDEKLTEFVEEWSKDTDYDVRSGPAFAKWTTKKADAD